MLLCKHGECEHKKRLISVHNTKYLLPYVILYLNAEVGGLSIWLKIKKERKKDQNKNNKRKQKTTTTIKKSIIAKLGFEPRSLAWKASVIAAEGLYHMDS